MTGSVALVWPVMTAAFLASLVEAVEALTIVLAVALPASGSDFCNGSHSRPNWAVHVMSASPRQRPNCGHR